MKKEILVKLILSFAVLIAIILLIMIFNSDKNLTGKAIFIQPMPTDCSDAKIKAVWDAVFKENSDSITINATSTIPGECNIFSAYKIKNNNELWLLKSSYSQISALPDFIVNKTTIEWQYFNLTNNYFLNNPLNIASLNFDYRNLTRREIVILDYAASEFIRIFQNSLLSSANWQQNSSAGEIFFFFSNQTNITESIIASNTGLTAGNASWNTFSYSRLILLSLNASCTPIWAEVITACNQSEHQIVWFNNSNNCSNYTTIPSNQTKGCDYDQNGFIGNITQFLSGGKELYIDSSQVNISKRYNETHSLEIKRGNNSIKFSYNLSNALDLTNITIQKQSSSSSFGYMLISGLELRKTIEVDKLMSSSNSICLKDDYITAIENISANCNSTGEYLIMCPGNNSRYDCNITSNEFTISGILHSGLKEFVSNNSLNCTSNWNCTGWSSCSNNARTRTCSNVNNCQNTTGKPAESEACVPCTPNWNCTEWSSKNCSKTGNQTRICTDLNNCGVEGSKREERKACEKKSYKIWLLIICVVILIMIVLLSFYLYKMSRKNQRIEVSISEEPPPNN